MAPNPKQRSTPAWEKGANVPGVGQVQRRVVRVGDEVDIICMILPEEGALLTELGIEGYPPGVKVRTYYGAGSTLAQRSRSSAIEVAAKQLGYLTDVYFDAGTVYFDSDSSVAARVQRSDELDAALGRVARVLRACGAISTLTSRDEDSDVATPRARPGVIKITVLDEDGCIDRVEAHLTVDQARNFAREL